MRLSHLALTAALAFTVSAPAIGGSFLPGGEAQILEGDQAFRTSMMSGRDGSVLVRWEMPAGYYLYRDKLSVAGANGLQLADVFIPAGEVKNDEFMGRVEIYRDVLTIAIDRADARGGDLVVKFQGCAEGLICYPPMSKTFHIQPHSTCKHAGQGDRHKSAC